VLLVHSAELDCSIDRRGSSICTRWLSRLRRADFVISAQVGGHVHLVKFRWAVVARCALLFVLSLAACGEDASSTADPLHGGGGSAADSAGIGGAAGMTAGALAPAAGSGGASVPIAGRTSSGGAGGSLATAGTGAGPGGAGGTGGASGSTAAGGVGGALAGTGGSSGAGGTTAYAPCPGNGEPCRILPLGDSITFGLGYSGGYRVELFSKALAASQEITFVGSMMNGPSMVDGVAFPRNNEGHSGWKIDQLLSLIPEPALADDPHIILLMIGTNDIAQNDDLANAPERLDGLLGELIAEVPEALLVVAQITPLSFGGGGVDAYNAALPAIVDARAEAGEHVMLVDMSADFPTSLLGDGVHPNQMGYERMAEVWYDAIGEMLD
jgi:lysophospholipase L1-like esterase